MTNTEKYALHAAQNGFRVFQVAGIQEKDLCACYQMEDCKQAGKHPIRSGNWKEYATTDKKIIKDWFYEDFYNLAIVVPENVLVIDVDPKNGGMETLKKFEAEFGSLGETAQVESGSGGLHLYFKVPDELQHIKIKNREILPGIDIKASGGYLVGPGSRHKSGGYYKPSGKVGFNLEKMSYLKNKAMIELLLHEKKRESSKVSNTNIRKLLDVGFTEGKVIEGSRNHFLFSIACSLRSKGFAEDQMIGALRHLNDSFCVPPLESSEVVACAQSAGRYPDCK